MNFSRLKQSLTNLITYKGTQDSYDFSVNISTSKNITNEADEKVSSNLKDNKTIIDRKYNTLINSDIIIRKFKLKSNNKPFSAFIIYIDGMSDSNLINQFILKPLMLRNKANTYKTQSLKTINKDKRVIIQRDSNNLAIEIENSLLPQNSLVKETEFNNIFSAINMGNCVLFVDTLDTAFNLDVKGFKQRSVSSPNNEIIIKGPQEAFVESIRVNTSMLRRSTNTENLVIENVLVGKLSKTPCTICYLKNIANSDLVAEVRYRLNNLEIDTLLSTGQLEQLICEDNKYNIPQVLSTERPDKAAKNLYAGRVVILVNGNPYCIILPATIVDFISSPEDTNLKPIFANFLKILRFLAMGITLLLPSIYIAIVDFHQELLPTELLFSLWASRENVPFPIIFELLVMEISFELIREAGLRVPSPVGPTIGIVGALVLGQAAVSASIVSPFLIIIVAITGIASFAIPDFSFGFHLRITRFLFTIAAYIAGFLGIAIGLYVYLCILCSIKSFGVSYLNPNDSINFNKKSNNFFAMPTWMQEFRHNYIHPKKERAQNNISMKWRHPNE